MKKDTTITELKDGEVECIVCGCIYEYIDEPQEVKEGSEHICANCWEDED